MPSPHNHVKHLNHSLLQRWVGLVIMMLLVSCAGPLISPTPPATSSPSLTVLPTKTASPEPIVTKAPALKITLPPSVTPTTAAPLSIISSAQTTVERYDLLELDLQTTLQAENPYDPQEIDLRVRFTAPSGQEVDVGAFWYRTFDYSTRTFVGKPGWKVRFTPNETGEWSAVAHASKQDLLSAPLTFTVTDSDRHGFVRIHPANPRYFAFEDGDFFFPIGLNMAWWSGAGDALTDYRRWLDAFAANGGNAIRVWMADWSFGIEWSNTPLGNYDSRLQRAWLLDQIFNMAEERDIYIMLVLLNCADFNNWQTNGWSQNPYNAANGGPLAHPSQFATDPTARQLLQRRLNYIVNRWGYSTHLLAWEWWNEANLSGIPDDLLFPWYEEMSAYLKAQDVNQHLITNSYAISDTSPSWKLPAMGIIQKHEYALQEETTNKDLAERAVTDLAKLLNGAPPKPAILGEFGYGDEGYGNESDKTGIHLHNGIWATTFAGYAGSGWYWWWDVYVEKYNLWQHFNGLSKFLQGEDLGYYEPFSPLNIATSTGAKGPAYGLGLRGEKTLLWIRSNAYTTQAAIAAREGKPASFVYNPPSVEGLVLTLNNMADGEFTVSWYEPATYQWLDEVTVNAQNGRLTISIPLFRNDIAAKVIRNP